MDFSPKMASGATLLPKMQIGVLKSTFSLTKPCFRPKFQIWHENHGRIFFFRLNIEFTRPQQHSSHRRNKSDIGSKKRRQNQWKLTKHSKVWCKICKNAYNAENCQTASDEHTKKMWTLIHTVLYAQGWLVKPIFKWWNSEAKLDYSMQIETIILWVR